VRLRVALCPREQAHEGDIALVELKIY
jgi:hypothetical protein